jgi:SPP1 gp7 family putative phage head morphogenesis protein
MYLKNAEYWENRFEQLEEVQHDFLTANEAEIKKQFAQTQQILDGQIALWYQKFADNNKITLAQAKQYVQGDALAELKWNVHEYIQYGKDNAITGNWKQQLENASAKFHITKLEALKIQTQQTLENLFAGVSGTVNKAMGDTYKSGYYHTAFELQKGFSIGFDISSIDQSQLIKILSKPWSPDKYNFSERIWGYKNQLISTVHNILTENIRQGSDPSKAIKQIATAMHNSEFNAGRLVMTEGAYFSSLSQRDCFEELGVKKYEIVATLDDRTSETCKNLDGKVFSLEDYKAGDTAPPFHCFCRSTTAPYLDYDLKLSERAARDGDGKTYYIPEDMNYFDWEKAFVNGDKSGFDLKVIEGTEHYSHKNTPAPSVPVPPTPQSKPKKTYLTKKKLISNISDADNKLDELSNKLSGLTGDEAEKVKAEIQTLQEQKNEWEQKLNDKLVKEQKKELIKQQTELEKELSEAQAELDKLDVKTYSGIWKDPVTTADYNNLNISGKKAYFESKLSSGTLSDEKKAEFENYLKQLEELEKEGKIYSETKFNADKVKNNLNKVTNDLNSIKKYGIIKEDNRYSQERKDNAIWAKSTSTADKHLRPVSGNVWRNASKAEKDAIYEYTTSYNKFNEPLRGIDYGTNQFLGVGNINFDNIGKYYGGYQTGQVRKEINYMTDIIDKSEYDFDIWLQRGCKYKGMDNFFGISDYDLRYATTEKLEQLLLDKQVTDYGFFSCGVSKGKGFSGSPIIMNVYCPRNTKMMYAEPFSYYGNGAGRKWDGISEQDTFSSESEMILQQGTTFRITKVERANGTLYVDIEVVAQNEPQR